MNFAEGVKGEVRRARFRSDPQGLPDLVSERSVSVRFTVGSTNGHHACSSSKGRRCILEIPARRCLPSGLRDPVKRAAGRTDPPDPAFDPLLKAMRNRSDAPIVLPTELSKKLKNAAVGRDVRGTNTGYSS
jgi:hypothetical protein